MNTIAKKAGIASAISVHSISLTADIISTPTTISAGAVANDGIVKNSGAKNNAIAKKNAVETAVKPVRPPSATPAALSI